MTGERADVRIAMLLGGFDAPTRSEDVRASRRPANDVTVLHDHLGATVLDFVWLERSLSRSLVGRLLLRIVRRSGQWSAGLAIASARLVREFDVVYVSGEDVAVYACAISRLGPRGRPRFIVRFERASYGRTRSRRRLHRLMLRLAAPAIDVALCRTAGVATELRESVGIPDARAWTLGQEIDTEFFRPEHAPPLPTGVVVPFVLSAGLERRDYATLLAAADDIDCGLVIAAGSPWSKDGFDVDRDLPDGTVVASFDAGEMRALYHRASVIVLSVHPTTRACGMNVIGEAWAMGRPVVATATSGLSEFIDDGVNGVLVPCGDPVELRAAIERVLADEQLAARLGAGGRDRVVESLSLDRFEETVHTAVDVLIGDLIGDARR